jgi:cytochrome oxidase assembly protein ShyY1
MIAMALVITTAISLGNWQTRRAEEKLAIEQAIIARSQLAPLNAAAIKPGQQPEEFRRIVADGEFLADWPLYLENRPHGAQSGFYLLMPLRLADSGDVVLVARGWFPRDPADRTRLPSVPAPAGRQHIEGSVRSHAARVMQLGDASAVKPGAILQNIEPAAFASASSLHTQAFIIEQLNDTHDGLERDWPAPSAGVDKHRGYAFQWYALAAVAFLFYLITGIRSVRKRDEQA